MSIQLGLKRGSSRTWKGEPWQAREEERIPAKPDISGKMDPPAAPRNQTPLFAKHRKAVIFGFTEVSHR